MRQEAGIIIIGGILWKRAFLIAPSSFGLLPWLLILSLIKSTTLESSGNGWSLVICETTLKTC